MQLVLRCKSRESSPPYIELTTGHRPIPLSTIAKTISIGNNTHPSLTAVKIMRREMLGARQRSAGGSTAPSSSIPSKATSETGVETNSEEDLMSPTGGTLSRDKSKMTREEREAQYNAARERIFADFQESFAIESTSNGENSASMSRSSSSSGKRKTRKHKAPKDDSFEARSAFIPSYTSMSMQGQHQNQFTDTQLQSPYIHAAGNYPANMNYGTTPTQAYPGFDQTMMYNTQYAGIPPQHGNQPWGAMQITQAGSYMNCVQAPDYQQPNPSMMPQTNNQYMQQQGPPVQQNPGWMANQYQSGYPQAPSSSKGSSMQWPNYTGALPAQSSQPYQYGQLPQQGYPANSSYNPQHPVPGSYTSRSLFNPQTRSFVPSNASSRSGGRNSRKKTPVSRNGNPQNIISSDSSGNTILTPRGPNSNAPSPRPREESLQQKYGAPANLPKKPPPSQVPGAYDPDLTQTATTTAQSAGTLAVVGNAMN